MRRTRYWRGFWILLLIPASSLVLQGALCSKLTSGEPNAPTVDVVVQLQNLDTPVVGENVHILGPGETYSAFNRLVPGESRTLTIRARRNEEVQFQAGRNGSNLPNGLVKCKCTTACPTSGTTTGSPKVEWNGTRLSCVAW